MIRNDNACSILRTCVVTPILGVLILPALAAAQNLDEQLQQIGTIQLAKLAREQGDPARGAIVFFQPAMACSKCHSVGDGKPSPLGPDLATIGQDVDDPTLVESVLFPSRVIRKGYEQTVIATADGRVLSGILVQRTAETVTLRDISRDGEVTTLAADRIEAIKTSPASIMPAGQANQLASRQQFLDLISYLIQVRDGGAERARVLQPSPTLLTLTLPEYEQHIDHAGLIRDWNAESLKRGEAVYARVCANCHGTKDRPGSLPTSLRFAEGKFKNGSDPLAMYRTLTSGFGFMAAQTWMVPSQKYDVIHYIREMYLRPSNPTQYVTVDHDYLTHLPKGDTRGPAPSKIEPWSAMDYGPTLTHTYQVPGARENFAYKGIAIRLDPGAGGISRGRHWTIFDTDTLRVAAAWSGGNGGGNFIDWRGVQFNGEHQIHPHVIGRVALANATGPGWANPATGDFKDTQRVQGRDGRQYGPMPRDWARFRGLYHYQQRTVLSYSVGTTDVLDSPRVLTTEQNDESTTFLRILQFGPRDHELVLRVIDHPGAARAVALHDITVAGGTDCLRLVVPAGTEGEALPVLAGISPPNTPVQWGAEEGQLQLKICAGRESLAFAIWIRTDREQAAEESSARSIAIPPLSEEELDLARLTQGGAPRWPERLTTRAVIGNDQGPFAVDTLTAPESNPWLAQTRFTGLDFLSDGRIAVCSWDGDVWLVEQSSDHTALTWQRIASGLFQPLGLKVIKDKIYVLCRDQLAVLHDLNGDGEIDFYECLNNDHQVTEHFHEFAMGLQTDVEGNFYYAKSARHALPAVVPQHGTLLRIAKDGSKTDILANGFRAANGVCLNPDGSFVVTDQEGHWNPKNRINWVTANPSGPPKFYGNMFGYSDVTDESDSAMVPPLCWITNDFDRSPSELLWVKSPRWGPLDGSLLNLSYGYGKVYIVPHEEVDGLMQGGMLQFPLPPFPSGVMRGRFFPGDGQLYLCGMFAWAGNATYPGGLYRVRATGQPMHLVVGLHAKQTGLTLTFTEPLDPTALDPRNVKVKTWSLKRTSEYGSKHYNETMLEVNDVALSPDGKSLTINIPHIEPTWCMEIAYTLRAATGEPVIGAIHNTIHNLGD